MKKRRFEYLLLSTVALGIISSACKNIASSNVSATTTLEGAAVDLTTYTGGAYPVYALFKHEIELGNYYDIAAKIKKAKILPKGKMTAEEVVALRWYTSNQYSKVNGPLRGSDPKALSKFDGTIKTIASGLNKIPSRTCKVIRGSHLSEAIMAEIEKKNAFIDLAFMSTTEATVLPKSFSKGNVTFKISSPRCRHIAWLSEFPKEDEVLFPPGSEFIVTNVETASTPTGPYKTFTLKHVSTRDLANEVAATKAGKPSLRAVTGVVKLLLGTKKGENYPPTAAERRPATRVGFTALKGEEDAKPESEMEIADDGDVGIEGQIVE